MEEHEELKSRYQNTLEEKQILSEKYENTKKELEEAIAKLEEEMNVHKSEKESHISKLDRQITLSEIKYMEEVCVPVSLSRLYGVLTWKCYFICIIYIAFSDKDHAGGNN